MKLIPCRICGGTPKPAKRLDTYFVSGHMVGGMAKRKWLCGKEHSCGRSTWFVCECGVKSAESTQGVKQARVIWNDENLEAHLQRQLIEATAKGEDDA